MRKIIALMLIALVAFTIAGCTKTETPSGTTPTAKENTELDSDIKNLDNIDSELNTSDLDNLEKDLENINWQ
ncbi:MAG: hypothetical protein ABIH63_02335 [archaeon]